VASADDNALGKFLANAACLEQNAQQVSLSVLLFPTQTNDTSVDEKPFSPSAERY
jgi:hypothetical protein